MLPAGDLVSSPSDHTFGVAVSYTAPDLHRSIHFDHYIFPAKSSIPPALNLRGAIAITRDSIGVTLMHKFISLIQRIHAWLLGREADHRICHAMVVLERDERMDGNLIVAHGIRVDGYDGMIIEKSNDLNDPSVTELNVFVPRDDKLRDLMCHHASLTAYDKLKDESENKQRLGMKKEVTKISHFSVFDMARSVFNNSRTHERTAKQAKRISYAVADLLMGNQFVDKNGVPRGFFCMPYVATVLQTSLLIHNLKEDKEKILKEGGKSRSRDEVAKCIQDKITGNGAGELSKLYAENPLFDFSDRYAIPCYTIQSLEKVSERQQC